jgi:hypothetical protein
MTLAEYGQSGIGPRDRRPVYEWAAEHVIMPAVLTGKGTYNPYISRHHHAVFDALEDDYVTTVVLQKPVRGGGTLISDVWHVSARARDPGPAMVVLQDEKMAGDHAETRLIPMFKSCEATARVLPWERHKLRKAEIIFNDGLPIYITGPAIGKLQSKGIRYMTLDEVWRMDPGIVEEAEGRLGDYRKMGLSKFFLISQAGEMDDAFDSRFKRGSMRFWSLPCLKCNHLMTPKTWTLKRPDGSRFGLVWDKHKESNGDWDVARVLPTVRFECEACGHPMLDCSRTKQEWNRLGQYVKTNDRAPRHIESFSWPGLIDYKWDELVEMFLTATNHWRRKDPSSLIKFFQKYGPEAKTEGALFADEDAFARTAYEINSEWPDEFARFATIDKQTDHYWLLIVAVSKSGEVRRLYFGKEYGIADCAAKCEDHKVKPKDVTIDAGFESKGDRGVYAACVRYGWIAMRGVSAEGKQAKFFAHDEVRIEKGIRKQVRVMRSYSPPSYVDPEAGTAAQGRKGSAVLVFFSEPTMNDRLQQLVDSGRWAESKSADGPMDREFRLHMTAERKREKQDTYGRTVGQWVTLRKDNHGRDCAKMAVARMTILGVVADSQTEERKA